MKRYYSEVEIAAIVIDTNVCIGLKLVQDGTTYFQ